ncbi:MAG: DUF4845 domain-containing protein [Gammaproteobacteria bacterium]
MTGDKKKMKGLTGLGFLLLLVLIGFFALLAIRLFPIYLEHYNVTASLKSLQSEAQQAPLSRKEVKDLLLRRFQINDISHLGKEQIKVESRNRGKLVTIAYEVRKPFIGNIDLVVSFKDSLELQGQ